MAETISLEVKGKVPKELLEKVYKEITPEYVKGLLAENGMSTDSETIEFVTASYEDGFPTEDLALRAIEHEDGMKFWGIASGFGYRDERMAVKYLVLEHIQEELTKSEISSEINIADLNDETIEYMEERKMFKEKLPELKKIAEQEGNLENTLISADAAFSIPFKR
jgi:hypothetical protein